jgi:hypothetical protein
VSNAETNKSRLVARVPANTVKQTKIAAVEEETTISEVVRVALEEWLERRNNAQNDADGGTR